jgi:hypothetical protein
MSDINPPQIHHCPRGITIYIASKFYSRVRLLPIRQQLISLGFNVLSTWMVKDADMPSDDSSIFDSLGDNLEDSKIMAIRDFQEVGAADVFIIDTQDLSSTGGREVEFGYAKGEGNECLRVGPMRNVFHALVDEAFTNWDACVRYLMATYPIIEEGARYEE